MILYLDFDGVLHPGNVVIRQRGYNEPALPELVWPQDPDLTLLCWAPILVEILAPHPGVRLVLSTSWAHRFGEMMAMEYLPAALRERVVGSTAKGLGTRCDEVLQHVIDHGVQDWIALDDLHAGTESWSRERGRLVRCDPALGLSCPTTQDALRRKLKAMQVRTEIDQGSVASGDMRAWEEMKPVGKEWGADEELNWD